MSLSEMLIPSPRAAAYAAHRSARITSRAQLRADALARVSAAHPETVPTAQSVTHGRSNPYCRVSVDRLAMGFDGQRRAV